MKKLYLTSLFVIMTLSTAHSKGSSSDLEFPEEFFFGIANAAAHVEDQLDDIWADFAADNRVPAFHNVSVPYERLQFWTHPEVELDLAQELGVEVFRLGIDWERLAPRANSQGVLDYEALDRYKEIIKMIKDRGMKVMVTLFHHSEPGWTLSRGSWDHDQMASDFEKFSMTALEVLADDVDYITIFNEAQLYVVFGQITGMWPSPYDRPRPMGMFDFGPFKGRFTRSLANVAEAHINIYNQVKRKYPHIEVGIAHNVGRHIGKNFFHEIFARIARKRMNHHLLDLLHNHLDFIGLNYYGAEVMKGTSLVVDDPRFQYSDSGRAIDPSGLYHLIKGLHERYNSQRNEPLPFLITENGIADSSDNLRGSFIIEHLAAVREVMNDGIPVLGYIQWTLTDNWEWADGYCPKFGLVAVDRDNGLERVKRPSFYLYQDIARTKTISGNTRTDAWERVLEYQRFGERPFCRSSNGTDGLDEPITIPLRKVDWRFSKHK